MKARRQEGNHVAIWCPACQHAHAVPLDGPVAWEWNDDTERPTITPSMKITDEHGVCHINVTDGLIKFHGDCTHTLKGQTLPLGDF